MKWNGIWQKMPHLIRYDFGRKALQFLLTSLVCLAYHLNVSMKEQAEREFEDVIVRVRLKPAQGLCLLSDQPVRTKVKISHNRMSRPPSPDRIHVQKEITFSDYNQAEGGPVSLNFTEKDVKIERSGLWDSAKFESAEICTVPVDEFVSQERKPVNVVYSSKNLPSGYRVTVTPLSSAEVEVKGPKSSLKNWKVVQTEEFEITNTVSYDTSVLLERPPYYGCGYTSEDRIRLHVEITPPEPRTFENVPVRMLISQDSLKGRYSVQVEPAAVNVKIRGHENVAGVRPEHLHPYVEITSFAERKEYPVQCWCDENEIEILEKEPGSVVVRMIPESDLPAKDAQVKK